MTRVGVLSHLVSQKTGLVEAWIVLQYTDINIYFARLIQAGLDFCCSPEACYM